MQINRRRAPSSQISSEKKIKGHQREVEYANLIRGSVIKGVQKGDVCDLNNHLHSVKSGKKWQIFLYGYNRINESQYLNTLHSSLEAFPDDYDLYEKDRIKCLGFKEEYKVQNGNEAIKKLSNDQLKSILGYNSYIAAKEKLLQSSELIENKLKDKVFLKSFLGEAIFNKEVTFLAIRDSTYKKDESYNIFHIDDVLNVFTKSISPKVSEAGRVPIDFNVRGQKVLLCYKKDNGTDKNIVEIEVRNDSKTHYRQIRFNMYSQDALLLLYKNILNKVSPKETLNIFGRAIDFFEYLMNK